MKNWFAGLSLLLIFVVILPLSSKGQDAINLLSGTIIYGSVTSFNDSVIVYEVNKKRGISDYTIESERVYSISFDLNKDTVIYTPTYDFEYSQAQMERFVFAGRDAELYQDGSLSFITGFTGAALTGYYLYSADNFFTITAPFVGLAIGMNIGTRNPKPGRVRNLDFLEDEAYVEGYKTRLKSIRFSQAVKGALLGTAVGVIAGFIERK